MLNSHAREVVNKVRAARERALAQIGDTAAALVRAQMQSGYAEPIEETGALMADVGWVRADEGEVLVGNTLPYAGYVHEGTAHMAARPYLRDALENGRDRLLDEAARVLSEEMSK